MSEPQAPLTPADCSSYGYMPLNVDRLHASKGWLVCRRRPELAFYMVNLWTAAWKETPAASLENDDDWLSDRAKTSYDHWLTIKAEVMRGFVLCTDGRWYHELIAVYALEAWLGKLGSRITSSHGNAKKHGKTFDDAHLREQILVAARMLFALDPNSQYFVNRPAVLEAIVGTDKAKKTPKQRRPKTPKAAPDMAPGGVSDGDPGSLPTGAPAGPNGVALNSTQLNSTLPVGGTPPTTHGAAAPVSPVGTPAAPSPAPTPAPTPAPEKAGKADRPGIVYAVRNLPLPDWLKPHAEAWNAFEEIRWAKHSRAPYTARAQKQVLDKLEAMNNDGQDLSAVLNASVTGGWTDVYPQRHGARGAGGAAGNRFTGAATAVFGTSLPGDRP